MFPWVTAPIPHPLAVSPRCPQKPCVPMAARAVQGIFVLFGLPEPRQTRVYLPKSILGGVWVDLNLASMRISGSRSSNRELNSSGEIEIISLLVLLSWRLLQWKLEIMAVLEDWFFFPDRKL